MTIDFDLISLNCKTPFRELGYFDGSGGRFNDDVMGFSRGFWSRVANTFLSIVGSAACLNPGNWFTMEDGCFGFVWGDGFSNHIGRMVGSSYEKPTSVGDNWYYRSKKLDLYLFPINGNRTTVWRPRLRPNYSPVEEE